MCRVWVSLETARDVKLDIHCLGPRVQKYCPNEQISYEILRELLASNHSEDVEC